MHGWDFIRVESSRPTTVITQVAPAYTPQPQAYPYPPQQPQYPANPYPPQQSQYPANPYPTQVGGRGEANIASDCPHHFFFFSLFLPSLRRPTLRRRRRRRTRSRQRILRSPPTRRRRTRSRRRTLHSPPTRNRSSRTRHHRTRQLERPRPPTLRRPGYQFITTTTTTTTRRALSNKLSNELRPFHWPLVPDQVLSKRDAVDLSN